jgi:hypothetical protein
VKLSLDDIAEYQGVWSVNQRFRRFPDNVLALAYLFELVDVHGLEPLTPGPPPKRACCAASPIAVLRLPLSMEIDQLAKIGDSRRHTLGSRSMKDSEILYLSRG